MSCHFAAVLAIAVGTTSALGHPLERTPPPEQTEATGRMATDVAPTAERLTSDVWYPISIETRQPPFNPQGMLTRVDYVPGEGASRRWTVCASLPGLQFEYIRAIAHGLSAEARRQGVQLRIEDAGAFDVVLQRQHLEACIEDGADALVVLAAQPNELNGVIGRAQAEGLVVVEVGTGSGSDDLTGSVTADAVHLGRTVGGYLVDRHPLGSDTARIAWVPGPPDADFARRYDIGFRDRIRDGALELATTHFSAVDDESLRQVLSEIRGEIADLRAVAGITVAVLAAVDEFGGEDAEFALISTNLNADVVAAIEAGTITAGVNDRPVVQGRIAIDIAVRALDGRPFLAEVRPTLEFVDASNVTTFDRSGTLAPALD